MQSYSARVAIWNTYLSLLKEYPFGTGPQGAYKIIEQTGASSDPKKVTIVKHLADNQLFWKHYKILQQKKNPFSDESMHIGFIVSFGVFGFMFWIYLIFSLIKNFKISILFVNKQFSVIYVGFTSVLIYGLMNSFHLGYLYMLTLCISYFVYKPKYKPIYQLIN